MTSHPRLTIRELRVRAVNVPMPLPLQTSAGTIGIAPIALIDLCTEEGVSGSTYLFCYTPLALKPVTQLIANLAPAPRLGLEPTTCGLTFRSALKTRLEKN